MERASGLKITVKDSRKRAGDIAVAYVDSSKAKKDLGMSYMWCCICVACCQVWLLFKYVALYIKITPLRLMLIHIHRVVTEVRH